MHRAKAAGLIDRFPNGRRPKHLPPLSKDRTIRRGQRAFEAVEALIEEMMAKREFRVVEEGERESGQAADVPIAPPQEPPARVTVPPGRLDELEAAEELLDDLLIALLEADLWEKVGDAVPDNLRERMDDWLAAELEEGDGGEAEAS
jgi:hypothetical protein